MSPEGARVGRGGAEQQRQVIPRACRSSPVVGAVVALEAWALLLLLEEALLVLAVLLLTVQRALLLLLLLLVVVVVAPAVALGLSPAWVRWWRLRWELRLKHFPHSGHL